jgi:hypothetical protein
VIWRLVQWADHVHLGRRLWAWRVPQIAAIALAVGAIGLGVAAWRARAREARESAANAAATEAWMAARLAEQAEACRRMRDGSYSAFDIRDCPDARLLLLDRLLSFDAHEDQSRVAERQLKEDACVQDFYAMARDEWRARWRDLCSAAVERQTGLTWQQQIAD